VQIARQLLAQGEKPNNVFRMCGFSDYAGFYRAFKAEYGAGPREFAASLR
jgi:AraC-like DNA-binding protein